MPGIEITLQTETGVQPVLTLSTVPQDLCNSIRRGCDSVTGTVDGKPELNGEQNLTIRFPRVGLSDWITYKWTANGELEHEGHAVGTPPGRSARQAPDTDFAHGSIVMMLESPHKQEMIDGRPASGPTGRKIEAYRQQLETFLNPFVRHLHPAPAWESLPFIIVNPCPYPTSCLAEVGKWFRFRDLVFQHLFPLVQNEFHDRLVRYRPCILINACTSGSDDGGGNIIFPDPNGGHMILQGSQTASPKILVGDQVERSIPQQDLCRSTVRFRRTGFEPETPVQPSQTTSKFLFDAPHPVSWR